MRTRRDFLTGCSVIAGVVALKPTILLSAPGLRAATAVGSPTLSGFLPQVGTNFRVIRAGQPSVSLLLTEAQGSCSGRPIDPVAEGSSQHQFSLLFSGPHTSPLGQGTYTFEHRVFGRLALFIVPVLLQSGDRQYYEAIFNCVPESIV